MIIHIVLICLGLSSAMSAMETNTNKQTVDKFDQRPYKKSSSCPELPTFYVPSPDCRRIDIEEGEVAEKCGRTPAAKFLEFYFKNFVADFGDYNSMINKLRDIDLDVQMEVIANKIKESTYEKDQKDFLAAGRLMIECLQKGLVVNKPTCEVIATNIKEYMQKSLEQFHKDINQFCDQMRLLAATQSLFITVGEDQKPTPNFELYRDPLFIVEMILKGHKAKQKKELEQKKRTVFRELPPDFTFPAVDDF